MSVLSDIQCEAQGGCFMSGKAQIASAFSSFNDSFYTHLVTLFMKEYLI